MQTDISKSWKYIESCECDGTYFPSDGEEVDLPVDLLRGKSRNARATLGKYGSYYDPVSVTFYRTLPRLAKAEWVVLEIEGVCRFADVCLNGVTVAHISGAGKHFIDITDAYVFGAANVCALKVWAPQMAGTYTGAGISGGVRLHTHTHSVALKEDGVFVTTHIEGGKAYLTVNAEIFDKTGEASAARQTVWVETTLKNARGKKTAHKRKRYKMKNVQVNACAVGFKLSRFYQWTAEDPCMYSVVVSLRDENDKVLDECETPFGIVDRALSPSRGLVLGGRSVKLKGAVVLADNGILGMESTPSAEEFKLSRVKEIGYNAVRFPSCPSEAALAATDKLGLMAAVDIFPVWAQGKFPYDGHVDFDANAVYDCDRIVCQLRKHPSVVLYGLDDDAAETYGRGEGSAVAQMLADAVRACDPSRPVSVNARERVPLRSELEEAGLKSSKAEDETTAVSMGRERDLFGKLTAPSFACGDVAGYAYLYPRYASDKTEFPDRLILGTASYPSRAFEAFEECEKNANVIGEFVYCAVDYLGEPLGKPVYEDEQLKLLPPHASYCGDLDLTVCRKPASYYRSIMLGDRSQSCIAVRDPEAPPSVDKSGFATKQVHALWNWPRSLGKPVEVEVYSGGEVVALYRDGKLIGRKLAGKVNRHIATFKTDYYPGTLEAVSYHKGRECSRVQLASVTAPRIVKLSCAKKSQAAGGLYMVEIDVTDKEGRTVPYASREVEVTVSGSGTLYALGSADPESQSRTAGVNLCTVYNGKALAVVRAQSGGDGKIVVRAVCDGLLSGKITLKVKDA